MSDNTDMKNTDEKELARLVRENVPDAFAELSARYAWLVRLKAGQFNGPSAPEREDLIQEGLLGLYTAAVTFDESKGSFSSYAGTCIFNRMADAARRHGSAKNKILNESVSLDSKDAAFAAAKNGPEELLEVRDQLQSLLKRLEGTLTPLERKALSLYLSGCRRSEVEARSGMTLKAYDNAIYRIRTKLKDTEDKPPLCKGRGTMR